MHPNISKEVQRVSGKPGCYIPNYSITAGSQWALQLANLLGMPSVLKKRPSRIHTGVRQTECTTTSCQHSNKKIS